MVNFSDSIRLSTVRMLVEVLEHMVVLAGKSDKQARSLTPVLGEITFAVFLLTHHAGFAGLDHNQDGSWTLRMRLPEGEVSVSGDMLVLVAQHMVDLMRLVEEGATPDEAQATVVEQMLAFHLPVAPDGEIN